MNTISPAVSPILLVEDFDSDSELIERALRRHGVRLPVIRQMRIGGTVDFLRGEQPLPALIVLDLKLGDENGEELLCFLKGDPELRSIPVIIWSGSLDPGVVQRCYRQGASGFVRKSADLETSARSLGHFANFWFDTATLPSPA